MKFISMFLFALAAIVSATHSDSNNAAQLPVKTQVNSPLVFCGLSEGYTGYKINAATCADCQPCEGDCHMVRNECVDGESACRRDLCLDCQHTADQSCRRYPSFRDEEECKQCDFDPSKCEFAPLEQCGDVRFCTVKNETCVAGECTDVEEERSCLKLKEQGNCTSVQNLRALHDHPCKKTCGLCHTIGMDKECKFDSGSEFPPPLCAPTTTCVVNDTHEKCNWHDYQFQPCICVKDKDVNEDCGYTHGAPYKCIRSSVCLVTATNEECGKNENVCSCVKIRDNGEDCGNSNGPPYPCIREDLCVVTNNITMPCSENASNGTCSCFRPTCSSIQHECQTLSYRNDAADNYSCDAKSLKCRDDICCTPVYDFLGPGKCERVDGEKLEFTVKNLEECDRQCTMNSTCGGYATSRCDCLLYISSNINMRLSKEQTDSLKCFVKAVECRQSDRNATCENCSSQRSGKSCAASDGLGICKDDKCATATASQCTIGGRKIAKHWICDGVKDCVDGSDEGDCDPCKCSGETTTSSRTGITQGGKDCKSRQDGKGWCYVNISAACADKIRSSKNVTQGWSFLACSDQTSTASTTEPTAPSAGEMAQKTRSVEVQENGSSSGVGVGVGIGVAAFFVLLVTIGAVAFWMNKQPTGKVLPQE